MLLSVLKYKAANTKLLKARDRTVSSRDSGVLQLCFFAQKMEMAIDFVKRQSFLENLFCAFATDGLRS